MAQYSVIGYYNTGFNQENIPDGPDILNLATKKTFNSIFHWQDRDLKYIEIQSDFNDICDVDYVQVGSSFYFVTNITMESETQCARLDLELDGLTTCGGIDGITILSGWMNRWSGESELFENTIEEPFAPTQDLVIEEGVEIKLPSSGKTYRDLVGSTVNLDDATRVAETYLDAAQEFQMLVPKLPPTEEGTEIVMSIEGVTSSDELSNVLPNLTLYDFEKVKENISSVRSLGMDSAITACYRIPEEYRGASYNGAISPNAVDKIYNATGIVDSGIEFKYGTYKHNKTYSGQFNQFILLSICSGEKKDFKADEIYDFDKNDTQTAEILVWADVSPEGCPFARPVSYLRNKTDPFMECIKGEKWQNTPIVFTQGSGYYNEAYDTYTNQVRNLPKTIIGTIGSALTGGLFGTATGAGSVIDMTMESNKLQRKYETVAPEVNFPRAHSIQNFVGNTFYLYRRRLSDVDSELFDYFLTMYGEAISTDLDKNKLHLRQYFDYVECQNVNIEAGPGLRTRLTAQKQLENGVRIWHTLPNPNYYNNNPLIGG